ncbi:MAG: D-glycero-D-manno-heptose 1-phosphate guanosyltransferase [Candidatus Marinimicrobia bacterium]|nr:D-glycero-D-manno-heptose 1-phosphate guanosyltransferase [Candidatus Neomarinimicrobiota bacterium]|tara:strand:+ start:39489 stop:40187 length:699 start_codon:yes stop_codon:yes gene_type:complete
MEAIILAGGFGTRLKSKIKSIPKPMAPINNRPFLDYIFDYLKKHSISHAILSVYHKSEIIKQYYNNNYDSIKITYSNDKMPLGTGGAIKAALRKTIYENIIVINGDTYFEIAVDQLLESHITNNNHITIALKPMSNFSRYGFVRTKDNGSVIEFKEKEFKENGNINGGICIIKNTIFNEYNGVDFFLFSDFIADNLTRLKIGSVIFDELFIDIGTPEDLLLAPGLLKSINFK